MTAFGQKGTEGLNVIDRKAEGPGRGLSTAITNAPDDYPDWSAWTYETHMADIKESWAAIRPLLKRDLLQAEWVDGKLREMIESFDAGEKENGRKAALSLYNSDVKALR